MAAAAPSQQPYVWKNVQMVGGGFVDGIVFHPTAKGVRYARTDMGGAYRWNEDGKRWEPLLDWVPYEDLNLMGVESIAVDPNDPGRVYLSCGTYTNEKTPNGAILRSSDRGHTFQRTNVPFKMGGNENGRGNGERMSGRSQRRQSHLSRHAPGRPVEKRRPRRELEQGRELSRRDGAGSRLPRRRNGGSAPTASCSSFSIRAAARPAKAARRSTQPHP